MKPARASVFLAAVVFAAVVAAAPEAARAEELNDASYERLRDHVLPKPEELGYRAIPWRATYWDAVVEAQEVDKPILLWVMNGHPLACT